MTVPFGQRLAAAMAARDRLCVGIDPHPQLLAQWGLPDDASGVERFALTCVEAFGNRVAAVKPQSAFFERHGSRGIAALEATIAASRAAGALVIMDAKRGDIGSTMTAYAEAYLRPEGPLAADALTVSPFLGYGSLQPAVEIALAHGNGLFVLALTSNPEAAAVQHARDRDGRSVAAGLVAAVSADNADSASGLGSVGLVIGATVGTAVSELGLDLVGSHAPILAPGFGAQGAGPAHVRAVFGPALGQVLVTSSRQILQAGPDMDSLRQMAADVGAQVQEAVTLPFGGQTR